MAILKANPMILKANPMIEPKSHLNAYLSSVKANIIDPQLLAPNR